MSEAKEAQAYDSHLYLKRFCRATASPVLGLRHPVIKNVGFGGNSGLILWDLQDHQELLT